MKTYIEKLRLVLCINVYIRLFCFSKVDFNDLSRISSHFTFDYCESSADSNCDSGLAQTGFQTDSTIGLFALKQYLIADFKVVSSVNQFEITYSAVSSGRIYDIRSW